MANFLRLDIEEGRCIYQYHIKFDPDVDSMREKENLIHSCKDVLGERKARNFDGGTMIFLPKRLPQKVCFCIIPNVSLFANLST